MLMGDTCTRACRFCSVSTAKSPAPLDTEEPEKLAETIEKLKLKYAVLTTVDRDDLPDFGAAHIKQCVAEIKRRSPDIIIELLAPDFQGDLDCIKIISDSKADVLGHNIECVRRITPKVRDPRASYDQSLNVLVAFKKQNPSIITKSSIMVGLGESKTEVLETMRDLRKIGVEILTIGQYLQPTRHKLPVEAYISPEEFEDYEEEAIKIGFNFVASGPLVRSSYKAVEHYLAYKLSNQTG